MKNVYVVTARKSGDYVYVRKHLVKMPDVYTKWRA